MPFSFALVVFAFALIAAAYDHKHGIIPDWLTYPMIMVGAIRVWSSADDASRAHEWVEFFFALSFCSLVPLYLYIKRKMGGGDLKLLMGIAACTGVAVGLETQILAAVAASVYGLLQMVSSSQNVAAQRGDRWKLSQLRMRTVRFGPAIFWGLVLSLLPRTYL